MADALVEQVRAGRWPELAAVRCGLDPRTLLKWIERGIDEVAIEPYRSFAARFLLAEADYAADLEDVLTARALGKEPPRAVGMPRPDPEVARYLLERRMPSLWGAKASGLSALDVVVKSESKRALRQKALAFLEGLTADDRQRARAAGMVLPERALGTAEVGLARVNEQDG
jgi:hypothetical protein